MLDVSKYSNRVLRRTLNDCVRDSMAGVVCMECALGYHGISTFNFQRTPMFYIETGSIGGYFNGYMGYLFVPKIDMRNAKEIKNGIYVAGKECTICDMVEYDGDVFHLFEALYKCYRGTLAKDFGIDVALLESMARERGIYDKLMKLKEECLSIEGR